MLVLLRKQDERIKIGDNIWITVVEIRPGRVRLGIDAPKELRISRHGKIQLENRSGTCRKEDSNA